MKLLKRVAAFLIIFSICIGITSNKTSLAATTDAYDMDSWDLCYISLDNEWISLSSYIVTPEGVKGYQEVTDVYYKVNDIAKLLKNTKREFNYKYDAKKNTLTFYPDKSYNAKDIDVKVKYTAAELKENKRLGKDFAYLRDVSVITSKKKQDVKTFVYNGLFYMKLEDIAKVANFGLSRDKSGSIYNINSQKKHKGIEKYIAPPYKCKVILSPESEPFIINDKSGIIKNPFPEAKLVNNPQTKDDFLRIFQYMYMNNIMSCRFETNVIYEDFDFDQKLYDNISRAGSEMFYMFELSNSGIHEIHEDMRTNLTLNTIDITFTTYRLDNEIMNETGYYEDKNEITKLKQKNKDYFNKTIEALEDMVNRGELTAAMTETQKARAIATWICNNVEYNNNGISDGYDAITKGLATCGGYTALYNLMCRFVGIYTNITIVGLAGNPSGLHAWTAQILDGNKVMTDLTWCDGGGLGFDERWFAKPVSYFREPAQEHFDWNTEPDDYYQLPEWCKE